METTNFATSHAPAIRSSSRELRADSEQLCREQFFTSIIDFIPDVVLILNKNRQVVFSNKAMLDMLRIDDLSLIIGRRPGEILNCRHSGESEGGCGTTQYCRYCGAVNAILKSQAGESAVEECRILVRGDKTDDAIDFRIWATPFVHHGEYFSCFVAVNIADEKQKHFMERIFLHDIMNTAAALRGFSDLIREGGLNEDMEKEFKQRISFLSARIIDEINAHRQLIAAENNELVLSKTKLNSLKFITGLYDSYNRPDLLDGRRITLDSSAQSVQFTSDEIILSRVVGNMIKNAIEASLQGESVTIGCYSADEKICFWVNNQTYMPEKIRLQIFKRSFSTKGIGRGLGTYSMKYLTEKYLQGQISFVSAEEEGTTFTATYPLEPE